MLAVSRVCGPAEWIEVTGPPVLVFPRDHGAHPGHRTEWWYVTGLVDAEDGKSYGLQMTFFRQGLAPGAAEAGIVGTAGAPDRRRPPRDHRHLERPFHHAERLRRADGGLAGFSTDRSPGVARRLGAEPRRRRRHGRAGTRHRGGRRSAARDAAAARAGAPRRSWVFTQGCRGRQRLGLPELDAAGRHGRAGDRWFASRGLRCGVVRPRVGHVAARRGCGRLGLVQPAPRRRPRPDGLPFRRGDGTADPRSSGTLVAAGGEVDQPRREDVRDRGARASGAARPPAAAIRSAGGSGSRVTPSMLEVRSLVLDAEVDGSATTGVVYWEGPVAATGSATGEGYVEIRATPGHSRAGSEASQARKSFRTIVSRQTRLRSINSRGWGSR